MEVIAETVYNCPIDGVWMLVFLIFAALMLVAFYFITKHLS